MPEWSIQVCKDAWSLREWTPRLSYPEMEGIKYGEELLIFNPEDEDDDDEDDGDIIVRAWQDREKNL